MKQITLQTPGITDSEATDLRNAQAAYQKAQTALQLAGQQTFNPKKQLLLDKVQPWVLLGTNTRATCRLRSRARSSSSRRCSAPRKRARLAPREHLGESRAPLPETRGTGP